MAEVQKHYAETTYDITGLTTRQAAVIEALLSQSAADPLMREVYASLGEQLRSDPTWRKREVVLKENYYAPVCLVYGYFTREASDG